MFLYLNLLFRGALKAFIQGKFRPDPIRLLATSVGYSYVFNKSHIVLGDMPNSTKKRRVCIARHAIPIYQRPDWNTEHLTSFLH